MDCFGNFKDVYHAYAAMDKFCNSCEHGCDDCKYALISEMSDVPCCFFWIMENCFNKQVEKQDTDQRADLMETGKEFVNKILGSFQDLMDLEAGRKSFENLSQYERRKADVMTRADGLVGEIEQRFFGGQHKV